jgi:hypothetical protein
VLKLLVRPPQAIQRVLRFLDAIVGAPQRRQRNNETFVTKVRNADWNALDPIGGRATNGAIFTMGAIRKLQADDAPLQLKTTLFFV